MQVSGISSDLVREIVKSREDDGPFRSALDFLCRIKANKGVIENLVLAGAFDSTDPNRKASFGTSAALQKSPPLVARPSTPEELTGRPACSMLKGHLLAPKPTWAIPVGTSPTSLHGEKFKHETSVLGFCTSRHAMEFFRPVLARRRVWDSRRIPSAKQGQVVRAAGLVVRPHRPPTKSGKTVVFLSLEDEYGLTDITVFDQCIPEAGVPQYSRAPP